jgi:hypothetical protein
MGDQIELHDSEVSFRLDGDTVVLSFRPAFVHHWDRLPTGWKGEGRVQSAELVIMGGSMVPVLADGVFEVSEGWFEIGPQVHDNLIPVPLEATATVRARLVLVNAPPVELSGEGIVLRLVGEAKFVEDLPTEWAPK